MLSPYLKNRIFSRSQSLNIFPKSWISKALRAFEIQLLGFCGALRAPQNLNLRSTDLLKSMFLSNLLGLASLNQSMKRHINFASSER
jgi:hypothetical protein